MSRRRKGEHSAIALLIEVFEVSSHLGNRVGFASGIIRSNVVFWRRNNVSL
jgi:hypothetical protein